MHVELRVGKHLDRFGAVLWVSGAQNQHFASFFDTPWTFFAQNVAKVYGGKSPQKREWKAQRKVREPLGFVRGPSFESMAIVSAIDGACILMSVRRAYLPHVVTHILKHNELRLRRWAF